MRRYYSTPFGSEMFRFSVSRVRPEKSPRAGRLSVDGRGGEAVIGDRCVVFASMYV
jgi:hypothetical protein